LYIQMNTLITYWKTQVIWANKCLLYDSLGGVSLPLGMI
jgi:hypothetical protein